MIRNLCVTALVALSAAVSHAQLPAAYYWEKSPRLHTIPDSFMPMGLVNHYYLGEIAKERGTTPERLKAKLHFFAPGDSGAMVNVSGIGVLTRSASDADARALVDYLLGTEAQTYFAQQTFEYPVVAGNPAPAYVPPLAELKVPAIDLNNLETLEASIALIKEAGLTP